ncbi:MAG: glutathione S-transferase family protein [Polyangiaceae bacterium]|nr:glutathione S-transferase family protein [Polyangiaceae bacterium]
MSTSYELLYFPLRGRAEPIRLLFALAKVSYTNTGVTNWPEFKPKTPLGQLPVLIERGDAGEKQIAQSGAIMRHLARVFDLYGQDEDQKVRADFIAETASDWRAKWAPVVFAAFMNTEQTVIDKYWADLPTTLSLFDRLLGNDDFFAGKSPTFADVLVFDTIDGNVGLKPECLKDFPRLTAFVARFRELPGIAEYVKNRA